MVISTTHQCRASNSCKVSEAKSSSKLILAWTVTVFVICPKLAALPVDSKTASVGTLGIPNCGVFVTL